MNKILNKAIFLSILMIFVLITSVVVKANGIWYDTSISISDNSTLKGKIRNYDYPYYGIDITPTSLYSGRMLSGKVRVFVQMRRPTYTLGIETGYQTKYAHYVEFDEKTGVGTTKKIDAGCGKGKLYFYFSTIGKDGSGYGSMKASAKIRNYS